MHCEPFAKSFEKSFADPATREIQVFRQIDEFFSKDFCQFDEIVIRAAERARRSITSLKRL